jgi:hypothetical protein
VYVSAVKFIGELLCIRVGVYAPVSTLRAPLLLATIRTKTGARIFAVLGESGYPLAYDLLLEL